MSQPHRRLTTDRAFARWASQSCPPPIEILRSISAALAGRPARDLDGDLDDLGRGLFDVDKRDRALVAGRVSALLLDAPGFGTDDAAPEGLLLDAVLDRRAGHPQLLAVVLAEAGRRAGFTTGVLSSPGRWYAALGTDGERALLVAPADPGCRRPPSMVRRHCGHELALAALLGLRLRYAETGDPDRANHAASMLLRLGFDVEADERAAADPLHVLWTPAQG